MKIEKGDFIRTKLGIAKCEDYLSESDCYLFDNDVGFNYNGENDFLYTNELETELLKQPSKDIIDLIEVGDIVNGFFVTSVKPSFNAITKEKCIIVNDNRFFYNSNIRDILTKEEYERRKYVVGGEK